MPKKTFAAALNDQIANEFAAAMQYIGVAVHYDTRRFPGWRRSSTARRSRSGATR